jgi:hypothetical protein
MKAVRVLAFGIFVCGCFVAACMAGQQDANAVSKGKARIGVFNSRAVALAYGRSKMFMDEINKLVAEAKEAKAKDIA